MELVSSRNDFIRGSRETKNLSKLQDPNLVESLNGGRTRNECSWLCDRWLLPLQDKTGNLIMNPGQFSQERLRRGTSDIESGSIKGPWNT